MDGVVFQVEKLSNWHIVVVHIMDNHNAPRKKKFNPTSRVGEVPALEIFLRFYFTTFLA